MDSYSNEELSTLFTPSTPTYPLKEERKANTEQYRASEAMSPPLLGRLSTLGLLK